MSNKKLFLIILDIVVIIWMFMLAGHVGGSLMYLSVFSFIVAQLFLYAGFFSRFTGVERLIFMGDSPVAGGFFLVMAIGTAFISYHQRHSSEIIAKWVTLYPSITDITPSPPTHHWYLWSFIVNSNDLPDKISDFYEDQSHTKGWESVDIGSKYWLEFKKPGYRLFIIITPDDFGKKSTINYQLENRENHIYAKFR